MWWRRRSRRTGPRCAGTGEACCRPVATCTEPTAYLSELAGDARWSLRELRSATAEYERALTLTKDPAVSQRVTQKKNQLQVDLLPQQEAERVAVRNGWLAIGLVGLLAALFVGCRRLP